MGSSSSGSFRDETYSASEIFDKIKNAQNELKVEQYETDTNTLIDNILSQFNNRDKEAINNHVQDIKRVLNQDIEGTVTTRFGGSVSKNTHLNGISDVDILVILNDSDLIDKSPQQLLNYFCNKLQLDFPNIAMDKGNTAVTIHFKDGDIQLLPAIRFKTGLKIPNGKDWSTIIKPTIFARSLTILNQKLNGRVIPAIKVIKGIISKLPENMQLSGYHIESLALKIFQNEYNNHRGSVKNKDLIKSFFKQASQEVRNPIKDITKQSKNVDDYLGNKNSINRLMVADVLDRNFRRMEMADSSRIIDMWKDIISPKT